MEVGVGIGVGVGVGVGMGVGVRVGADVDVGMGKEERREDGGYSPSLFWMARIRMQQILHGLLHSRPSVPWAS